MSDTGRVTRYKLVVSGASVFVVKNLLGEHTTFGALHWDAIDVRAEVDHIWSIANTLRGTYSSDKYKNVVIPMIIIRRLECALAGTKTAVLSAFERNPNTPEGVLKKKAGFSFYNTSRFTLTELLADSKNIAANFENYIEGFSTNIQKIINSLDFKKEIEKMDKNNRLYGVVKKFSELALDPKTVDSHVMGYMFEDLIRRFSTNAEAGDHYTPREVIRLMVNIILAEGCDDLLTEGKVATVLDMACGTGGMLSTLASGFIFLSFQKTSEKNGGEKCSLSTP